VGAVKINGNLARRIIHASACRCGARIGQKCRRRGVEIATHHPTRLERASNRFPEIAAALVAAREAALAAIAERKARAAARAAAGLPKSPLYGRMANGRFRPGFSGNPKGRRPKQPLSPQCGQQQDESQTSVSQPTSLSASTSA
jgi:hypothetical protein